MYDASDIEIKIAWWNNRLRKSTKGNLSYNLFTHTILNISFQSKKCLVYLTNDTGRQRIYRQIRWVCFKKIYAHVLLL